MRLPSVHSIHAPGHAGVRATGHSCGILRGSPQRDTCRPAQGDGHGRPTCGVSAGAASVTARLWETEVSTTLVAVMVTLDRLRLLLRGRYSAPWSRDRTDSSIPSDRLHLHSTSPRYRSYRSRSRHTARGAQRDLRRHHSAPGSWTSRSATTPPWVRGRNESDGKTLRNAEGSATLVAVIVTFEVCGALAGAV